jgi:D-amino-acid dehydrogenase
VSKRIAVIGAGVVGMTTAWELANDGHQVTVFERRGSVAAETSFAHAGLITPALIAPWARPAPGHGFLKELLLGPSPTRRSAALDLGTLRWLWRWHKSCTEPSWHVNRAHLLRLALYSRARLHALTADQKIDYERSDGVLVLLRGENEVIAARPALKRLAETGTQFALMDAARCRAIEPGLSDETSLQAGIHLKDDEAGNCREFVHRLRGLALRRGVQFMFDTEVRSLVAGTRPEIEHVHAPAEKPPRPESGLAPLSPDDIPTRPLTFDKTREAFDAVVICAATGAPALLRPLGMRLPMAAVCGYSLTAPLRHHEGHPDTGPRSAVIDARHDVTITRLGQRIRVSGAAELGGQPGHVDAGTVDLLYKVLADWYPAAAQLSSMQRWKGARPTLPDGPPVIGPSGSAGIWLNIGHGGSGWTLACGSARILADAVAGRQAEIDTEGFDVSRLR